MIKLSFSGWSIIGLECDYVRVKGYASNNAIMFEFRSSSQTYRFPFRKLIQIDLIAFGTELLKNFERLRQSNDSELIRHASFLMCFEKVAGEGKWREARRIKN